MVDKFPANVSFEEISLEQACSMAANVTSAVGHADTAAVFSYELQRHVPCNRANITLRSGERALLGQYIGSRLPEGSTRLPKGASIKWLLVEVI
jgi:hypothetical protein